MGEAELLEFYRKKFEEIHKTDDKFRERIDKYLRDLISDRNELEADSLRKSEKISDLQKALVDLQLSCFEERERFLRVSAENEQFKKNEENLHLNIRQLLNATKEKDLRDRIIYTLEDPKVEVGYRHRTDKRTSSPVLNAKSSSHEFLKEQVQKLQSELVEHSKVCENKSRVILEDCRAALEKSKEKLTQNAEEILNLQDRLEETEKELSKYKQRNDPRTHEKETDYRRGSSPTRKGGGSVRNVTNTAPCSDSSSDGVHTNATDMHLTLVLLSKILNKVLSLLQTIQSSQVFIEASKVTKAKSSGQKYVGETDVVQLQNYVRQCTRLSFDISNLWKVLNKKLSSKEQLSEELKNVEAYVEELAVATAEADLLTISLSRATFFDYLTSPKGSFTKFGVKEMHNLTKYTADVFKIERSLRQARDYALKTLKLTQWITAEDEESSKENRDSNNQNHKGRLNAQGPVTGKSENSRILDFVETMDHSSQSNTHLKSADAHTDNRDRETNPSGRRAGGGVEGLTRKINKTLSKIQQIESGEYFRDTEFYKHLSEQISVLTQRLKDLYDEFNVTDLQAQFNEYSSLTLSKLETIAKQSHNAVIAAEAQISAHRSNARNLSQKLRATEDLLRESIHECLDLKQKLHQESIQRETEKAKFREKMRSVSGFDDLEREVTSGTRGGGAPTNPLRGPYECKAGSGHRVCEEKIKDLRSNNQKLATELKLLKQETKEEKKLSKLSQEEVAKVTQESAQQTESLKNALQSLESKNASLLEQLKLEKSRLKNMERFRRLEIVGFQTDVKNLKNRIQDMEKQLMKAVLIFEHDKKDLELLKSVHTTAQNSKQAVGSIKRLKAKLYELETDIKHL